MSFPYTMRGKPSEILGVEVDQRLQELAGKFALAWKLQGSPRPSPEVMERELVGGKGKAAFWPHMRDLLAWHQEEGVLRQPPKEKWDEVELPEEEAKRRGVKSEPIGDQRELSPEVAYLEELAERADVPLDIFSRFEHMRRLFNKEWQQEQRQRQSSSSVSAPVSAVGGSDRLGLDALDAQRDAQERYGVIADLSGTG